MVERTIVVDDLKLTYEGLFDATELFKMVDKFFRDKGYDKKEIKNIEKVDENGKFIEIVIEPWKKVTDYAKNIIKLRMIMSNVKEVEVEKDRIKVRLNQGRVQLIFDSYLETDYESRWEQKPIYVFLRTMFEKYFYKSYTEEWIKSVADDTYQLHSMIKSFLNLYRY